MLVFGIISEVDAPKGLARVQFPDLDGIVSNWLPMSVPLTLNDKFSIPFFVNEHVWCMMDEKLEYGVIGGAIYSTADSPGSLGNTNKVGINFAQGLNIEYNRSNGTLSITGNGKVDIDITGEVDIKATTKVTINAPVEVDITAAITKITGNVSVVGTLTAGAIAASAGSGGTGNIDVSGQMNVTGDVAVTGNLSGGTVKQGTVELGAHLHSGVTTGGGTSGPPVP